MRSKREAPPARTKALACLSRREYTRSELERRLLRGGYSRAEVRRTLNELEEESLLSNERFISEYIRSAERKNYGPTRIRWNLKNQKGLSDSEIEKGMTEAGVDWVACARRCCIKKFGGTATADRGKYLKRRGYLFQRGFSGETIRAVLSGDE